MADNLELNAGTGGAVLATEDEAGVHYQKVKLTASGTGTTEDLSKAEDSAHLSGDHGLMALAVRKDAVGTSVGTDGDYAPLQVNAEGHLRVAAISENFLSTNNSTATPLGSSANFTGVWEDVRDYATISTSLTTDVDSSADGMLFEFSSDGVNIDYVETFNMDVSSSNKRTFQFAVTHAYYRVNYTNGAGAQTYFRVQTLLHSTNLLTTIRRLADGEHIDSSVQVVKSAIIAQTAGGASDFVPVQATGGGNLKVAVEEFGAALLAGTAIVGDVGISGARTSGGTTLYKNIDVDETEDQVKASAGQIYWIHAINLKATPLFLKLYNATAASVTVGTTVPDLTFPVPSQGTTNGAGFLLAIPNGIEFSTAITVAATTGVADADSGAPGANELIVNLGYA